MGRMHEHLPQRQRIRVAGVVQGVGFRPFVWRLASELGVSGWVRNDAGGVEIEVEGDPLNLAAFSARVSSDAPPLARVDSVNVEDCTVRGERSFNILASGGGRMTTAIPQDVATCPDCLAELFNPQDRRWRYPFINCTQCGPRYTITRQLPYDRSNTSMAVFALCPNCRDEYENTADRRFHAEPNACPVCGPRLSLRDAAGSVLSGDPLAETLRLLRQGAIVAIKGLGGFHLVCDAQNPGAVALLRQRKNREEKPFAVMLANTRSIRDFAEVSDAESALLESRERPIVLLRKRPGCDEVLADIAPGVAWLGAMLPYTPLHWLLFHEAAGRSSACAWMQQSQPLALVMTSANPGGEPLVTDNDEALRRLTGIADAYLLHDRDIVIRCDDSVVRSVASVVPPAPSPLPGAQSFQFVRRARGYTPRAIRLAKSGPNVLAVGGWYKNTICVTRGDEAFVSQHIGDLDNAPTCAALAEAAEHFCAMLDVQPEIVARDLHPDFHSSRLAADFAAERGLPIYAVQHHHAHIGAVLAEYAVDAPVIGLALDGVGLGDDGAAWGGELLRIDGARCTRLGHLRPLPLPGGDRAAREPWRMAAAALHALGRGGDISPRFADRPGADTIAAMLERGLNCPPTSSMGRVFDAAAGLLDVRAVAAYEGQAAMQLEGLAERFGEAYELTGGWTLDNQGILDLMPLLSALSSADDAAPAAALFHATLIAALTDWTVRVAEREDIQTVAFGGGCFLNHILAHGLRSRLNAAGIAVLEAHQLPPNDGGLSLGQAWVARQLASSKES
jgi:hydrogenase maturation protein HypF